MLPSLRPSQWGPPARAPCALWPWPRARWTGRQCLLLPSAACLRCVCLDSAVLTPPSRHATQPVRGMANAQWNAGRIERHSTSSWSSWPQKVKRRCYTLSFSVRNTVLCFRSRARRMAQMSAHVCNGQKSGEKWFTGSLGAGIPGAAPALHSPWTRWAAPRPTACAALPL